MLYTSSVIQIFWYLLICPLIISYLQLSKVDYAYIIPVLALLPFVILTPFLKPICKPKVASKSLLVFLPKISSVKFCLFFLFFFLFCLTSIQHGLYNGRIGTDEVALRAASLGLFSTLIFRSYQMALPYFLSCYLNGLLVKQYNKISYIIYTIVFILSVLLSGLLFSRIGLMLCFVAVLIINQNFIYFVRAKSLMILLLVVGIAFFVGVTFYRIPPGEAQQLYIYLGSEILSRTDGLELLSSIISLRGYSLYGYSFDPVFNSLISMLPFLPQAVELKSQAMTTVKSYILVNELSIRKFDFNSFVTTDLYFWGGPLAIVIFFSILCFVCLKVDSKIGKSQSLIIHTLLVSVVLNVLVLESESISIVVGIFRLWLVLYIISVLFLVSLKAPSSLTR